MIEKKTLTIKMKNYLCVGLIYSLIFLTANASISNNLKCYSGVGHISESHIYCPNNQKFSCSVSLSINFVIINSFLIITLRSRLS